METLTIPATQNTPAVTLNTEEQIFLIEGESYPESAHKFYQPILEWLSSYEKVLQTQKKVFEKNRRMTFQFKLEYFNSTSARYIKEIFLTLDKFALNNLHVRVKWFYEKEDTDMKEAGEEFKKMTTRLETLFVEGGVESEK